MLYAPLHDFLPSGGQYGIAKEDVTEIIRRAGRVPRRVPEFALGEGLRIVLAARAWAFLHQRAPLQSRAVPPNVVDLWKGLDRAVSEFTAEQHRLRPDCQKTAEQYRLSSFAGSYLSGQCAIAYAAWRGCESNAEIAERFGLKADTVGWALRGMMATAEKLGLPTCQHSPLRGRYHGGKRRRTREEFRALLSAQQTARLATPEYKEKLSAGVWHNPAVQTRKSAAMKAASARRKAAKEKPGTMAGSSVPLSECSDTAQHNPNACVQQ